MEHEFSAGDVLFGIFYPRGYIVAVFDAHQDVDAALDELVQHDFEPDDVRSWTGKSVLAYHENLQEDLGIFSQLVAKLPLSKTEQVAVNSYLEFARDGHEFITVRATDEERIETASKILTNHGAHSMRHYGDWTVTILQGDSPE